MKALTANEVWPVLQRGGCARMADEGQAKFRVGDTVVARQFNHPGHIRLPEYVQGHRGVIAADRGVFLFPDQHAKGIKAAQRLYSVRFNASDIWTNDTCCRHVVYLDLFESYLVD